MNSTNIIIKVAKLQSQLGKYAINRCVIQGVKSIFDKVTFWPQLISKRLITPALLATLAL